MTAIDWVGVSVLLAGLSALLFGIVDIMVGMFWGGYHTPRWPSFIAGSFGILFVLGLMVLVVMSVVRL